jgi:hypothetical protein
MIVALCLYEAGRLSTGEAAEIVNLSKRAFLEVLPHFTKSDNENSGENNSASCDRN